MPTIGQKLDEVLQEEVVPVAEVAKIINTKTISDIETHLPGKLKLLQGK